MKLCLIPPTYMISVAKNEPYQLTLAHQVLKDINYATAYKLLNLRGSKIIMDNSLWELGEAMSTEELREACDSVGGVYELTLPDSFKSSQETIQLTEAFLKRVENLEHKPWQRNLVVPHGSDREDWLLCYDYFIKQSYADTIALPKVLDDIWAPGGRVGCCLFLEATNRIDPTKQYHCFGIRNDPIEVLLLSRFKWLRSLDTALPIHAGLQGVKFDAVLGLSRRRPRRPKDYFKTSKGVIRLHEEHIRHNVKLLKLWASGHHITEEVVETETEPSDEKGKR